MLTVLYCKFPLSLFQIQALDLPTDLLTDTYCYFYGFALNLFNQICESRAPSQVI